MAHSIPACTGLGCKGKASILPPRRVKHARVSPLVACADKEPGGSSSSLEGLSSLARGVAPGTITPVPIGRRMVNEQHMLSHAAMISFSTYLLGTVGTLTGAPGPGWAPALTGAGIGLLFSALHRFCHVRLWRPPRKPLTVLITGGSKGLGKAMAREFLQHGDKVIITSRTQKALDSAISELLSELSPEAGSGVSLTGFPCDVSSSKEVAALADFATQHLGSVDVWVCNAGYSGGFQSFQEAKPDTLQQVVSTNLLGSLLCCREATRVMASQAQGGHIFLMDGAGSDGLPTPMYLAYGATKAALPQLAATLQKELADTPVGLHVLSPGMMLTELLLEGATTANKQVFNILCEHPETAAAFLVPRARTAVARGTTGTYTKYLTPLAAMGRLLRAPSLMGRFFDAAGRPVYPPEHERILGKAAKATARQQAQARALGSNLQLAYSLSLALSVAVMVMDGRALQH